MNRHFDDRLNEMKAKLLEMGDYVKEIIRLSIKGLLERKTVYKERIYDLERKINNFHIEIDEIAFNLLALMQPVAADMRFLVMSSKINSELERVGDHAVNIFQSVEYILRHPPIKPLEDFPKMASIAESMLSKSLESFLKREESLADWVLSEDKKIDAIKETIFRKLLDHMFANPSDIECATSLILISRNLERIGDLATNIAEEVIYMIKGKEIRHYFEEKPKGI